jgi:GDP-mannose 6-dehydrogenase
MRIVVVGLGYVGVTAAACLASQGHDVIGVDVNESKVRDIGAGVSPISEPGVSERVAEGARSGRLTARTSVPHLGDVDLVIGCVGTPSAPDGSHNMGFIAESTRQIAEAVAASAPTSVTVAFRSTFRPGTMDQLITPLFESIVGQDFRAGVELVYNPEFLREASAVSDFFRPPKVVVGTVDGEPSATMTALNEGIDAPRFDVGYREAEITKFVDNTWHATKVAFANEVGRLCAALDVQASTVHEIFISDRKLNISEYYLRPGGPFGGSCLPKDVRALQHAAREAGVVTQLIASLMASNEAHLEFQFQRIQDRLRPGSKVLFAGLSFKAGTDDLRESPNVVLVRRLLEAGHDVAVYEPALATHRLIGQNLGYTYTRLPTIDRLLVDAETAQARSFDLVVLSNATGRELDLEGRAVLDIGVIP